VAASDVSASIFRDFNTLQLGLLYTVYRVNVSSHITKLWTIIFIVRQFQSVVDYRDIIVKQSLY